MVLSLIRPLRAVLAAAALLGCGIGGSVAQDAPDAAEAVKSVVGAWEMSNADRERKCTLGLRAGKAAADLQPPAGAAAGAAAGAGASGPTLVLDVEAGCSAMFPFMRGVVGWAAGARDAIRLVDAKGQPLAEFFEVEGGLYEAERPGEGLLFLQSVAAGRAEERNPAQLAGDWALMRGNAAKPICQLTLLSSSAANERLALRLKPGCDASVTRFAPAGWTLDRGQLLLVPARGEPWRFEESDPTTWRRIPEGRDPLMLVRQ